MAEGFDKEYFEYFFWSMCGFAILGAACARCCKVGLEIEKEEERKKRTAVPLKKTINVVKKGSPFMKLFAHLVPQIRTTVVTVEQISLPGLLASPPAYISIDVEPSVAKSPEYSKEAIVAEVEEKQNSMP